MKKAPAPVEENAYDASMIAMHHEKMRARREARRRRHRTDKRHRMRLVDDIINRLFGRRFVEPSKD
jgi:hypothetical protein